MTAFATGFTQALAPALAAEELALAVEAELGSAEQVGGGLLLATAAMGAGAFEVASRLEQRWRAAELLGTSFEGILYGGRAYRDEPALGLLAWGQEPPHPIPLLLESRGLEAEHVAEEILAAVGRAALGPDDLVLLFPDAIQTVGIEVLLADLGSRLGSATMVGAAASGSLGDPARGWIGGEAHPGALLVLVIPGGGLRPVARSPAGWRASTAGASRQASPWLEITGCRSRWVDQLDGEPALDWVRRQLGLASRAPLEAHLDRLLVRWRPAGSGTDEPGSGPYRERFVIGLDHRRGALSLPDSVRRGDELALALPDAGLAREALRRSLDSLAVTPWLLQLACRSRDASLHGDPDLEAALVDHHVRGRRILGAIAPFQIGPSASGAPGSLVHSNVLVALGEIEAAS